MSTQKHNNDNNDDDSGTRPGDARQTNVHELIKRHPADVAGIIGALNEDEALALIRRFYDRKAAASALEEMPPEDAARLLAGLDRKSAVEILSKMAPDDAVDLLAELPPKTIADILKRLNIEDSRELSELLKYPPDTAGGMMSPEFIALPLEMSAHDAIETLRVKAGEAETVNYVYVVDNAGRLQGVLPLRDLVFANPGTPVERLMKKDVFTLPAGAAPDDITQAFDKYNYLALPVVGPDNKLLGIITVDDAMDAMRREDTEDVLRMSGIPGGEEHPLSRPLVSVRNRLPWMMANIMFDIVAVLGVAFFEDTIMRAAFLAVLMPIISDMGGNVATQAMAVAIRGMAAGAVRWEDFNRVIRKEFLVGLINGAVLGLQISLITWLWRGNPFLGVIAALSLWINTVLATIAGGAFPFLARRAGIDPAMISGAVVTTLTDLTGFFLFLGLATLFIDLI